MNTADYNKDLLRNCAESNSFYKFFSGNDTFWDNCPVKLIPTPWRKVESKNSLMFEVGDNANQAEVLKEIFGIKNKVFEEKYKEAIGGDGQEKRKIMTLHSSSLLSLLCFYKVSNEQSLEFKISINDKEQTFHSTEVSFEFKNNLSNVYEKGKALTKRSSKSNIDIVLSEGNLKGTKKVLFLESKFSEYLHNGAVYDISKEAYKEIYEKLGLHPEGNINIDAVVESYQNKAGKDCYKMKALDDKRTHAYLEGVKQMISHFMGACTYAAKHPDTEVYLGSIVYQFEEKFDKGKFSNYNELFQGIMKKLQGLLEKYNQCSNLHLVDNLLTYNDLFLKKNPKYLDGKVAEYYRLDNKEKLHKALFLKQ